MSTTISLPRDVFAPPVRFNDDAPMSVVVHDLVRDFATPTVPTDARAVIYAGANRLAKAGAR